VRNTSRSLFEQVASSMQLEQLLGALAPAERPEARAAPARHDDGVSVLEGGLPCFSHSERQEWKLGVRIQDSEFSRRLPKSRKSGLPGHRTYILTSDS